MNLKKLTTLLFAGVTAATPFATNAQNPTILQGNYISNVFGQANFVLNPNAQTNVANVTLTNATATRSTTTPLVATSEWNVTVTSANGTAAWATRSFDAGMKNQNCEARFSYRGFQATSKAQIKQGANVVAELTLTPSATDPRIASINFPCGDLSSATTFVITDTATLAGTHEIGGIYVGLATNQANVAQAEFYGSVKVTSCSSPHTTSGIGTQWESFTARTNCIYQTKGNALAPTTNIPAIRFNNLPAGNYQIVTTGDFGRISASGFTYFRVRTTDNAYLSDVGISGTSTNENAYEGSMTFNLQVTSSGSQTIEIQGYNNTVAKATVSAVGPSTVDTLTISVYRFPTSSELVVTPETQNVWGGVVYTAEQQNLFTGTATPTSYTPYNDSTWNKPAKLVGKAQVTTTNSGNDLGFSIPNMPVGNYKVTISGLINAANNGATNSLSWVRCNFRIVETDSSGTLRTEIARQSHQDYSFDTNINDETRDYVNSFFGVYNNTSVATRNFRLEAQKFSDNSTGSVGGCQAYSSTGTNSYNTNIAFTIEPLDNKSNSALYVQGPVKAAGTGTAIPAGYVGEEVTQSSPTSTTISINANIEYDVSNATITLGVGVWELQYFADVYTSRSPASTLNVLGRIRITDSANIAEPNTESFFGTVNSATSTFNQFSSVSRTKRITITSGTKTYKLRITCSVSSANGTCAAAVGDQTGAISGSESSTYIRAVRIN